MFAITGKFSWRKLTSGAGALLLVAACGSADSDAAGTNSETELEIAHEFPEDHQVHVALLEAKEWLENETNNRISFYLHSNGAFGDTDEMEAGVRSGALFAASSGIYQDIYAPAGAVFAPYTFRDYGHWREFADSAAAEDMLEAHGQESGFLTVGLHTFGFRYLATKGFGVKTPEDMEGHSMRVVAASPYNEMDKVLNAEGTPIPIAELYLSLESGVIDATANPLSQLYTEKLHEVTTHLNLTRHMIAPGTFIVSRETLDELDPADAKLVREALEVAADGITDITEQDDMDYRDRLEEAGMTVIEPDRDAFAARASLVTDSHPEWQDLLSSIEELDEN